jgi:16S rRNA processing protein RimM
VSTAATATRPSAELVSIGRIDRPWGRNGAVVVTPLSDRPGRFEGLRRAFVGGPDGVAREVAVEASREHRGRYVVKLSGVESIDAAERYRGLELGIGEEELEPLPEGSYYHHELAGLSAESEDGASLGRVREVLEAGAAPVLVIEGPEGELLVPLAEPFVRTVDLAAGRIRLVRPVLVDAQD